MLFGFSMVGMLRRSVDNPAWWHRGFQRVEDDFAGCLGDTSVLFVGVHMVAVLVDDVTAASTDPPVPVGFFQRLEGTDKTRTANPDP